MTPPAYVVDTQALVWFAKGQMKELLRDVGLNAFIGLLHPRARVVIPSYVLEEIHQKFVWNSSNRNICIPPTSLLRLIYRCKNARIIPRAGAALANEFTLKDNLRLRKGPAKDLDKQDIPIAAAALTVRDYYPGKVVLITSDSKLKRWAVASSLAVLEGQYPFRYLPS